MGQESTVHSEHSSGNSVRRPQPKELQGNSEKEKTERRKKLCEKFYKKEWIHEYWVDPDSDSFHNTMNARTYSEQTF